MSELKKPSTKNDLKKHNHRPSRYVNAHSSKEVIKNPDSFKEAGKRVFKNFVVILLLILFFPVGLYLMFKKSGWSKKSKLITTSIVASFLVIGTIAAIFSPPSVTLDNIKLDGNKSIEADNFTIKGTVYPYDSIVTVNGKKIKIDSQGKLSYRVPLKEGDNDITIIAKKDDKQSTVVYKIHRYTKAEIAKQKADRALKLKNELEAKTAAELKSKQESDKKTAAAKKAEAERAAAAKKATEDKIALESAKTAAAAKKAAEEAAKAKTMTEDDYLTLVEKSKETVKKVLKAPSTAKFQGSWLDPYEGWGIYAVGTSSLRLASTVDSQNSFGAMLRSSFSITYCKGNNLYQITLFVFDGATVLEQACSI